MADKDVRIREVFEMFDKAPGSRSSIVSACCRTTAGSWICWNCERLSFHCSPAF